MALELFVASSQWIDAWSAPLERCVDQLAGAIAALSGGSSSAPGIEPATDVGLWLVRWCHVSALRWEDLVETPDGHVLHARRKQVRGVIGNVSRKKRAPRLFPLPKAVAEICKAERKRMIAKQVKGVAEGYMFPSSTGMLRQASSLRKAWTACAKAARIEHRFTVHGTRYTFTDLGRRAGVKDEVVRSLTGHVTVEMQSHYSHIGLDEQRQAVRAVLTLVPLAADDDNDAPGGDRGGDRPFSASDRA